MKMPMFTFRFLTFQLIGVVKVSLHPFYMSFKEPSIAKTLLQSQVACFFATLCIKVAYCCLIALVFFT